MSDALEKQWKILREIPRWPKKIAVSDIKRRLDRDGYPMTPRTIQRHLMSLSSIFPIEADERERPFGWYWAKNAETSTIPGLDLQTALVFSVAEKFLEPLLPASTFAVLASHFQAARTKLDREPKQFASWTDNVRTLPRGFRLLSPVVDTNVQATIYEALLRSQCLEIVYQGRDDPEPKRIDVVHPLGLVFRDPLIYLVCTMWDYGDARQVLLHRVRHAVAIEQQAVKPAGFTLDGYINSGAFGFAVGPKFRLKALFSAAAAKHLYECAIAEDQVLKFQSDGRVLVEATVADSEELRWWLLGFGNQATVIRPRAFLDDYKD